MINSDVTVYLAEYKPPTNKQKNKVLLDVKIYIRKDLIWRNLIQMAQIKVI